MRQLAFAILCLTGSLAVPACAQKTHPRKTTAQTAADRKEFGPVLTFQRTPCFGTCPGYLMKVYADGRVEYEGTRAVPMMGQRELQLPPAALANMLHQAQESHFEQFKDSYLSGATDLPSTIIAIRQPNGELKKVVIEGNAPDDVRQLATALGSQFDALAKLTATSDR